MLKRLASIGQRDLDDQEEPMPQSPGDVPPTPDSSRAGGLASVFKGLTSGRLAKSPPPVPSATSPQSLHHQHHSPAVAPPLLEPIHASSSMALATPSPPPPPPNLPGMSAAHMESLEQLRGGTPSERIAAAAVLRHAVADYPLNPVLDIWYAAKDLIEPGKTAESRQAGWELLAACARHTSSTDLERKEFFQTLTAPAGASDFHLQLAALADLTRSGRELSGFEYDVLPLLRNWLHDAYREVKQARRHVSRAARAITRNRAAATSALASGEEKNVAQLFRFVMDVIKFNSSVADDVSVGNLIDCLLSICMDTTFEDDLRSCIAVLNCIVTFGAIPTNRLKSCVHVLSSIYCLVHVLEKDAWNTLSMLCKSHNGQATVRILLDILRNSAGEGTNEKDMNREIRGALTVLRKLLGKSIGKGYPAVPLSLLVDGLAVTVKTTTNTKAQADVLRLVNALFDRGDGTLHRMIVDEDWSVLLDVAAECAKKSITTAQVPTPVDGSLTPQTETESPRRHAPSREEHIQGEEIIVYELLRLIARLEVLIAGGANVFVPRQTLVTFFTNVHPVLPDSAARSVLDYFYEFRCCSPSDLNWEENLDLVMKAFFADRKRTSGTRLLALRIITDAFEILELVEETWADLIPSMVQSLLEDVAHETDIHVLEGIVSLMVSVATQANAGLFEYIISTLRTVVVNDQLLSPATPGSAHSPSPTTSERESRLAPTPSAIVIGGFVRIFMRVMNFDGEKAVTIFDCLVHVARSNSCDVEARLTAMKLLFRLRSNWESHIFLAPNPEVEPLASSLYRTEASLRQKKADEVAHAARSSRGDMGGPSRSSRGISFGQGGADRVFQLPNRTSGSAKPGPRYEQRWSFPDPKPLPEPISAHASPVLISQSLAADTTAADAHGCSEESMVGKDEEPQASEENMAGGIGCDKMVQLDPSSWLTAILHLFRGCDWEVYSFVLAYLPAQLTDHSLFARCIDKIQDLRRVLCDEVRMNSFQEPPLASGLRKGDVAICLFHSLTVILSYNAHFQRQDEDDMVRTFVQGINQGRSAKACIHALSICCHELPMATSKSLVQMLQRMAQIVTQQNMAIHILEFLACLSRMTELYVNFREDEYRIVFGIAFRYLQYVRDKRQSHRNSAVEAPTPTSAGGGGDQSPHPSAADDLPQYVYALAYHVITFWFMALRLPDRAAHVGWIAKNLFTDVDGAQGEEQALITMDFMQRVAYSDADESAADDVLFADDRFGPVTKRQWLVGNSIVTVQQAADVGWSQIIKRQPSGTSAYTVRETFRRPPPHQVRNPADHMLARDSVASGQSSHGTGATVPNSSSATHGNNAMVLPNHLLVQLMASIPQTVDAFRPVPLPDDDAVDRALRIFDRCPTVDAHKAGVIYVGEGQTSEVDMLANVSGSADYHAFLDGLGTLVKLQGAAFNTQGLDTRYGSDGLYTFCWRDRVSEIVFHVTTQMPTDLVDDARCSNKKRHIGNDYVNIIFNDSGLPFEFDTFASQFNYVNIVITPETRAPFVASREMTATAESSEVEGGAVVGSDPNTVTTAISAAARYRLNPFYKVTVMSKPGFPEISPAAETKLISLKALPGFVRLLAINASVFSQVWAGREMGEHVSPWRARLREIRRLRDKYGGGGGGGNSSGGRMHHQQLAAVATPVSSTPSPPPTALGHIDVNNVMGGGGGGGGGGLANNSGINAANNANSRGGGAMAAAVAANNAGGGMRDSFSSFRRASVATFLTNTSEQTASHRSSVLSTTTTHDTEVVLSALDALVDSVDFSKWA